MWVLPSSSTTSSGVNVTSEPCWPCISSTSIPSPGLTRCCLPPALITAYIGVPPLRVGVLTRDYGSEPRHPVVASLPALTRRHPKTTLTLPSAGRALGQGGRTSG